MNTPVFCFFCTNFQETLRSPFLRRDGRRADLLLTVTASATMGDQGPNSLRFSSPAEGGEVREESNLVGVGIVFQPVEDGTLYVKRMREDSPAARSGLIQIGDCLCEVNGR